MDYCHPKSKRRRRISPSERLNRGQTREMEGVKSKGASHKNIIKSLQRHKCVPCGEPLRRGVLSGKNGIGVDRCGYGGISSCSC